MLDFEQCDAACEGSTTGETCGGTDKITAYIIEPLVPEYIGCYTDSREARAMDLEGMYASEDMTNEVNVYELVIIRNSCMNDLAGMADEIRRWTMKST